MAALVCVLCFAPKNKKKKNKNMREIPAEKCYNRMQRLVADVPGLLRLIGYWGTSTGQVSNTFGIYGSRSGRLQLSREQ